MTVGLFAGSLIAQEQVGPGYFADPKVLLSFVTWGLYVVILFIRRNAGLRGRRAAWLTSGVFVLMLCVWAANLLGSVHSSAHRFGLK
jgi:ABC-type transport system involved in cytochrome c biogenesis permease subunit